MEPMLLSKIGENLIIMFSLTIIILSLKKAGLLEQLYKPLDKITNSKTVIMVWFMLATTLSAFTIDLTLAYILTPLAVLYAEYRDMNKVDILLATTWGNMVGSEWTYFGGGDDIIGWMLLSDYLGHPLDMLTWARLFWVPTFLALLCTLICLILLTKNQKIIIKTTEYPKITIRMYLVGTIGLIGLCSILVNSFSWYITAVSALIAGLLVHIDKHMLLQMPYKGFYIWTMCIVFGTTISSFIKNNVLFSIPQNAYSLLGIIVILVVVIVLTNIMTNTGLTTILLPLVIGSQFTDNIWLYVLVTKAIGMSYLSIFANSGLAVASSYGLSQKTMFSKGLFVVFLQLVVLTIYFYFMRGMIII